MLYIQTFNIKRKIDSFFVQTPLPSCEHTHSKQVRIIIIYSFFIGFWDSDRRGTVPIRVHGGAT